MHFSIFDDDTLGNSAGTSDKPGDQSGYWGPPIVGYPQPPVSKGIVYAVIANSRLQGVYTSREQALRAGGRVVPATFYG